MDGARSFQSAARSINQTLSSVSSQPTKQKREAGSSAQVSQDSEMVNGFECSCSRMTQAVNLLGPTSRRDAPFQKYFFRNAVCIGFCVTAQFRFVNSSTTRLTAGCCHFSSSARRESLSTLRNYYGLKGVPKGCPSPQTSLLPSRADRI